MDSEGNTTRNQEKHPRHLFRAAPTPYISDIELYKISQLSQAAICRFLSAGNFLYREVSPVNLFPEPLARSISCRKSSESEAPNIFVLKRASHEVDTVFFSHHPRI